MSAIRFLGIVCFSASLYAQFSGAPGISINGELRSHSAIGSNEYLVEVYDARSHEVIERVPVTDGQFELDHIPSGSYTVRVVTAAGETPIVEEYHQFEFAGEQLVLTLPERATGKPISGLVSLHDLEHPIPKKAIRAAYEAQQLEHANNIPKAIAKLEKAVQIAPGYRDAHLNLGVLYARSGRISDARAEFQKAVEIGPPAALVYTNLALTDMELHQYRDAETSARRALQLDPANTTAQRILQSAAQH